MHIAVIGNENRKIIKDIIIEENKDKNLNIVIEEPIHVYDSISNNNLFNMLFIETKIMHESYPKQNKQLIKTMNRQYTSKINSFPKR